MAAVAQSGTLLQDGYFDASSGVWHESSPSQIQVSEALGLYGAWRFGGFTSPSILLSATLTLALMDALLAQLPATLRIYAKGGHDPAAWASGNPPPADRDSPAPVHYLVAARTLLDVGPQTLAIDLDAVQLAAAALYNPGPVGQWAGVVALHAHIRTADGTPLELEDGELGTPAALSVTLDPQIFHGFGLPWGQEVSSRADFCPLCGCPSLRETWKFCAYHRRMECPDHECGDRDRPRRHHGGRFELEGED